MNREILSLYAITDRTWLKEGECLKDKVEQAILGGVTIVQYREKHLEGEALRKDAIEVRDICRRYGIPFIVNDDVMLAYDIDADGVHVGQSDMEVSKARNILGDGKIIGATAKTVEQAVKAYKEGADYLGSGAVFGSTTKTDAKPMSRECLEEIIHSVPIPVVAIGGIDEANAHQLRGLPIAGISVIKGIFGEGNVRYQAAKVKNALYGKKVVQCITNHVTVNDVANVVLAMGASPIMAHHEAEVEQIQEHASALVLNLGATDDYKAMEIAMRTAIKEGHPIVIDPVGVAVSSYRREFMNELLKIGRPTCIRGNFSEIMALLKKKDTLNGLDDDCINMDITDKKHMTEEFAAGISSIVIASGSTDIISDGRNTICTTSGHPMQREITGSGCMLTGALAAVFALCERADVSLAAGICSYVGDSAYKAAREVKNIGKGSMSFKQFFIDNLTYLV